MASPNPQLTQEQIDELMAEVTYPQNWNSKDGNATNEWFAKLWQRLSKEAPTRFDLPVWDSKPSERNQRSNIEKQIAEAVDVLKQEDSNRRVDESRGTGSGAIYEGLEDEYIANPDYFNPPKNDSAFQAFKRLQAYPLDATINGPYAIPVQERASMLMDIMLESKSNPENLTPSHWAWLNVARHDEAAMELIAYEIKFFPKFQNDTVDTMFGAEGMNKTRDAFMARYASQGLDPKETPTYKRYDLGMEWGQQEGWMENRVYQDVSKYVLVAGTAAFAFKAGPGIFRSSMAGIGTQAASTSWGKAVFMWGQRHQEGLTKAASWLQTGLRRTSGAGIIGASTLTVHDVFVEMGEHDSQVQRSSMQQFRKEAMEAGLSFEQMAKGIYTAEVEAANGWDSGYGLDVIRDPDGKVLTVEQAFGFVDRYRASSRFGEEPPAEGEAQAETRLADRRMAGVFAEGAPQPKSTGTLDGAPGIDGETLSNETLMAQGATPTTTQAPSFSTERETQVPQDRDVVPESEFTGGSTTGPGPQYDGGEVNIDELLEKALLAEGASDDLDPFLGVPDDYRRGHVSRDGWMSQYMSQQWLDDYEKTGTPLYKRSTIDDVIAGMTFSQIIAFQEKAIAAKLINPEQVISAQPFRPGVIDYHTKNALEIAMTFANQEGGDVTYDEMMDQMITAAAEYDERYGKNDDEIWTPSRAYFAPDYATVAQEVKAHFSRSLGRDPNDWEMQLLANEFQSDNRSAYDQAMQGEESTFDAQARAQEIGEVAYPDDQVAIDPVSRMAENFEEQFKPELNAKDRWAAVQSKSNNLFGSFDKLSRS